MPIKYGLSCVHSQHLAVKVEHAHTHSRGNGERTQAAWGTQTKWFVFLKVQLKKLLNNANTVVLFFCISVATVMFQTKKT